VPPPRAIGRWGRDRDEGFSSPPASIPAVRCFQPLFDPDAGFRDGACIFLRNSILMACILARIPLWLHGGRGCAVEAIEYRPATRTAETALLCPLRKKFFVSAAALHGRWPSSVIRYRSLRYENRPMSAMRRKRRLAVNETWSVSSQKSGLGRSWKEKSRHVRHDWTTRQRTSPPTRVRHVVAVRCPSGEGANATRIQSFSNLAGGDDAFRGHRLGSKHSLSDDQRRTSTSCCHARCPSASITGANRDQCLASRAVAANN
jgi:hypothetical protein